MSITPNIFANNVISFHCATKKIFKKKKNSRIFLFVGDLVSVTNTPTREQLQPHTAVPFAQELAQEYQCRTRDLFASAHLPV